MAQGLRFECQRGCTECCRRRGFVYLSEQDLLRAAAFVGMSPEAFERKYVYRTRRLLRLRVPRDAHCHFLNVDGCSIHSVKPTQCRVFPFWPELIEDEKELEVTAQWCPGIGKGDLVSVQSLTDSAREMRKAYPHQY